MLAGLIIITVRQLVICIITCGICHNAVADEVRVAVAANFRATLAQLVETYTATSGHQVIVSAGSTGKLYAQLMNGAPYDVLLAADTERPKLLEQNNLAVAGSRFTYAMGRLMLCGNDLDTADVSRWLRGPAVRKIALANPRHAPYGQAAVQALAELQLQDQVNDKLIRGENISQALQFLLTGNADAAFIARSQRPAYEGPCVDIGNQPVVQQAVLMNAAPATTAFRDFLIGIEATRIIAAAGYDVPVAKQQLTESD